MKLQEAMESLDVFGASEEGKRYRVYIGIVLDALRKAQSERSVLIERYPSCPEKDGWWVAKVSDPYGNIHEVAFTTKDEAVLYETGLNEV